MDSSWGSSHIVMDSDLDDIAPVDLDGFTGRFSIYSKSGLGTTIEVELCFGDPQVEFLQRGARGEDIISVDADRLATTPRASAIWSVTDGILQRSSSVGGIVAGRNAGCRGCRGSIRETSCGCGQRGRGNRTVTVVSSTRCRGQRTCR